MIADDQTGKADDAVRVVSEPPVPGLVVIFTRGQPACAPISLRKGAVELGRAPAEDLVVLEDDQVSRRHVRVALSGQGIEVRDLGSRNGTFVDGKRVQHHVFSSLPRVLRLGNTLLRFAADIALFQRGGVLEHEDGLVGPTLRHVREKVIRAGVRGDTLLLTGPSGAGKELAARAFHAATGRGGPFVAVNCAAVPEGLAERLFFGARRGAYSDATADAEGYVQAAHGGTLFLDEIAELEPAVQPKLLRVLEMREVVALGDTRPRKVDIRICAATLRDLQAEVAGRRFRQDLYYRIGRPEVRIPPLIERIEELPWFVAAELQRSGAGLTPTALFLEACAVRPWPGNVRELLREVRQAGLSAVAAGRAAVEAPDLSPTAGLDITDVPERPQAPADLRRVAIEAVLRREQGNITRAARALGMHRSQLRRWLARNGVDAAALADAGVRRAPPKPAKESR
ncbi:sigma 54-interacting transcriptional regulator [Sorangium cellulosum]|uniref:sigma 54-interacting transcriptional regulator n=1 Tax=Sorangium cellulosum TaxID=56 RepID=UPI001F43ECAB|nr:sigma 54-interacting transcriptional regulator [Sorangium cellulosum]